MSKERLEEIKNSYLEGIHSLFGTSWVSMPKENFEWLIQQAERVQELESELNKQIEIGYKFEGEVYDLAKENKCYREAINNIIEKAMLFGTNEEVYDAIQDAIKVLEGAE